MATYTIYRFCIVRRTAFTRVDQSVSIWNKIPKFKSCNYGAERMTKALIRSLAPATVSFVRSAIRLATTSSSVNHDTNKDSFKAEDVEMTLLLQENDDHKRTFVRIITDEKIVFTSSWIEKWFGIENLKNYRDRLAMKLNLAADGDKDVLLPPELLERFRTGASPTQLALDRFFTRAENAEKLAEIYRAITARASTNHLGYFKFEDRKTRALLGGGALAPLSEDNPVEKADIALHIIEQKKGIGSACLGILLEEAFERRGIKQIWGSSTKDHSATPTICARHGMIMVTNEEQGIRCYFIDDEMWRAARGKSIIVEREPINAATYYKNRDRYRDR